MTGLSHSDVTVFFLAIAVLLGAARIAGEIAQRFRQPAVVGELLAGVLLGPTVFGVLMPEAQGWLFPSEGPVAVALSGLTTVAIALFLLVAGMEIDLSSVWRQGRSVVLVGAMGIAAPAAIGVVPAAMAPEWFGAADVSTTLFAAFFGTAMAITALPVIAKILMDLKLFQAGFAVTIISAAIVNDLIGWIAFAFILSLIGVGDAHFAPLATAGLTFLFTIFMLTVGRWAINRSLPWIQAHTQWPSGVLAFALTLGMLAAAFTEWIGVHAIFGAFLLGIALGDSAHLRRRTRSTIEQFVGSIFAPLFFASIGLKADFAAHFDLGLVIAVLVIASLGKILGCWFAAKLAGFDRREAWAVGFGMNARGAMEIVLGLLALEAGVITERLFVALVVMAILTSMTSGVLIQFCLGRKKTASFMDFVSPRAFVSSLEPTDRVAAVRELALATAGEAGIDPERLAASVVKQERAVGSGLGNGVAIPHARTPGLARPVVGVGICRPGLDFGAPDGRPVRVVLLVLTPAEDADTHLAILKSIAHAFRNVETAQQAAQAATTLTEFRAFLRAASDD